MIVGAGPILSGHNIVLRHLPPIFCVQSFIIEEAGLILDVQDKVLRLAYSRKLS